MTTRASPLLLVTAIALLAACNGDDDTTPSTTAPAVTTSAPTPTTEVTTPPASSTSPLPTAPVTTTTPPTTSANTEAPTTTGPTSVQPTTVPPTVVAPPTTGPLTDEEQVLALVENTYRVWRECLRDIPSCDRATFREYFTGPLLADRRDLLDEWQSNGYEVRSIDTYTYEVIEVNLDFVIPHVIVCETDGAVLVQAVPGQPEQIIEQGYVERIRELHLVHTPLGWRSEGFATREQVEGEEGALCS